MSIFMQKGFIRKLIISIVCVILLNFCFAPNVQAKYGGEMTILMREFATAIADVAATVVQLGVTGEWTYAIGKKGTGIPDGSNYWIKESNFQYPLLQVSPELIFAGEIELLDVNFITPVNSRDYTLELKDDSGLTKLRSIVASWYVTLRTIAIVGLLSVLIYIGIRIIISSTSGEKAKYKQRLLDWIIAFCLLFFMHYIMAATITVVEKVNDMLGDATGVFTGIPIPSEYGTVKYGESLETTDKNDTKIDITVPRLSDVASDSNIGAKVNVNLNGNNNYLNNAVTMRWIEHIADSADTSNNIYTVKYKTNSESFDIPDATLIVDLNIVNFNGTNYVTGGSISVSGDSSVFEYSNLSYYLDNIRKTMDSNGIVSDGKITTSGEISVIEKSDGTKYRVALNADKDGSKILYFINYARLFLNVKDDDQYIPMSIAYLIIYVALVTFTAVFTIRYIKRVIYIAFLTMIAPLVALTYPLDKLKDRKSTGLGYVV